MLLEVIESSATRGDLPALFHDLSERLPRLVNFDTLWLVPHDPARNVSEGGESWEEEIAVPAAGRPSTKVLKTAEPLILNRQELSRCGSQHRLVSMGLNSVCFLPMMSRDRIIGTLNSAR